MIARIVVDAGTARVFAPYETRELIKSFPGRRWNPEDRCWTVGDYLVDELANALRAAGCTVLLTHRNGDSWTSGRAHTGHRDTPATSWAEALLIAVGEQRADKVFRALVRCLHPDVAGGSTELMRDLNNARDRLAAR